MYAQSANVTAATTTNNTVITTYNGVPNITNFSSLNIKQPKGNELGGQNPSTLIGRNSGGKDITSKEASISNIRATIMANTSGLGGGVMGMQQIDSKMSNLAGASYQKGKESPVKEKLVIPSYNMSDVLDSYQSQANQQLLEDKKSGKSFGINLMKNRRDDDQSPFAEESRDMLMYRKLLDAGDQPSERGEEEEMKNEEEEE